MESTPIEDVDVAAKDGKVVQTTKSFDVCSVVGIQLINGVYVLTWFTRDTHDSSVYEPVKTWMVGVTIERVTIKTDVQKETDRFGSSYPVTWHVLELVCNKSTWIGGGSLEPHNLVLELSCTEQEKYLSEVADFVFSNPRDGRA